MLTYDLLNALVSQWLTYETPNEIGLDYDKVWLLKRVKDEVAEGGAPAPFVQDLYKEVFFEDVWGNEQKWYRCAS